METTPVRSNAEQGVETDRQPRVLCDAAAGEHHSGHLAETVEAVLALEGDKILKYADAYDTPLEQLAPSELGIGASFQWDDGYPRQLQKVEYQVGELTETNTGPTFDEPYLFPISTFDNGTYTVRVRAYDELGMVGESAPQNFTIEVIRPPAPTPTPDQTLVAEATNAVLLAAKSTEEAIAVSTREAEQSQAIREREAQVAEVQTQVQQMTWATIGSVALAVIAFAYAIYILSSRDRRRQATQVITGTVAAVTEPFRCPRFRSSAAACASGATRRWLMCRWLTVASPSSTVAL